MKRSRLPLAMLLCASWLAVLLVIAPASAADVRAPRSEFEQTRIEHLIATVGGLRDARFVRNGRGYDAIRAAEHLRGKLDYAGERVQTAEQFIDRCATASWLSRKKYVIRFRDGRVVETAAYLRARLEAFDARASVRRR